MERSKKEAIVSNLKEDFKESGFLVVTHYAGLNVKKLEELRSKMRAVDVKFKIAKNRLTKLALSGTSFENVSELFSGPTAMAYSKDSLQVAKVVADYAKNNKKLIIIGGSYEGKLIDEKYVKFLASLPSLDELRARIASLLVVASSNTVSILQEPGSRLVRTINAYSKSN